jgi:apolipoprotein N-acyltransferase
VSAEFVFSRWVTPYGSWASLAYTQSEQLALLQLASLTGVTGISFLMAWFASVVAWMLRPGQVTGRRVKAGGTFAVVMLAVLVFGQLRLATDSTQDSVRAAALGPSAPIVDELEQLLLPVRRGEEVSDSTLPAIEAVATRLNEDLLRRTRREARAGARLIAWSETAGRLFVSDEEEFLARASRLAGEERVVLLLGLGVWHPDRSPPFENKVVAIDATGTVAWQYHKAHPIIGAESSIIDKGTGSMLSLDEEYGRVGAVICHDLDFPSLLQQASADRIGLVVAPSADWSVIAVLHARMAVFRAVENGFTLLRPTSRGRSIAVDTRGRVIARLDFAGDAMVADVSAVPVRTVYGMVVDLFSWLCLAGLVLLPFTLTGRLSGHPGARSVR